MEIGGDPMITPNDIETKVFSYSVRGYNKREVDEFLDQIMIDYQALLDQNAKMLERVHVLQKQVTESKDPAKMTRDAKRLMNDISASAEQKAEIIIKNAKHDAENIVRNAKNSTSQADEDAERLRRKVEKFKLRYKQMLEEELSRVDDASEDLLDDLRKDFFPGYIYGEGDAEFTKVAGVTPADDIIADLPDVEPEEAEEPEAEEGPFEEEEEAEAEEELSEEQEEADEMGGSEAEEEEPEEAEEPEAEEEPEEEEDGQGAIEEEEEEEEPEAEEPSEEEAEAEEPEEEPEEEIDDPLLARAKEANVDVDDLPGFRSSLDDTVVIKKKATSDTVDITSDVEGQAEPAQSELDQAKEKAKELKDSAAKLMNDIFSKKEK